MQMLDARPIITSNVDMFIEVSDAKIRVMKVGCLPLDYHREAGVATVDHQGRKELLLGFDIVQPVTCQTCL